MGEMVRAKPTGRNPWAFVHLERIRAALAAHFKACTTAYSSRPWSILAKLPTVAVKKAGGRFLAQRLLSWDKDHQR